MPEAVAFKIETRRNVTRCASFDVDGLPCARPQGERCRGGGARAPARRRNARLGADVDRYCFIVVDSYHLLLAGLTAHLTLFTLSFGFLRQTLLLAALVRRYRVGLEQPGKESEVAGYHYGLLPRRAAAEFPLQRGFRMRGRVTQPRERAGGRKRHSVPRAEIADIADDVLGAVFGARDDDTGDFVVELGIAGRQEIVVQLVHPLDRALHDGGVDAPPDRRRENENFGFRDLFEDAGPVIPFAHVAAGSGLDVVFDEMNDLTGDVVALQTVDEDLRQCLGIGKLPSALQRAEKKNCMQGRHIVSPGSIGYRSPLPMTCRRQCRERVRGYPEFRPRV
jgi:hypothetical protein